MKLLFLIPALLAPTPSIDGVWRSVGWGFVYEIRGSTLQAFEVTSSTCVQGFRAHRVTSDPAAGETKFQVRKDTPIRILHPAEGGRQRILQAGVMTSIVFERLDSLPALCKPPTPNTPRGNFDVFAQTFAEHYISFDLRQVDWTRTVAGQRMKIGPQTSPAQLFEILAGMIKPLSDIHTGIEASKPKRTFDASLRPGTDRVVHRDIARFEKAGRRKLAAVTDRAYLRGKVRSFCRGQWQYGQAGDGIGYLRILAFGDYARREGFEENRRALDQALDVILGDPSLRGLVIDLRLSFGGDDQLGLAIAARLTAREYPAFAIEARAHPTNSGSFTPPQTVTVRPSSRVVFKGPVVELIGPITMSAAETFTQALMERTPHVTRIGENTQGVFCDVLDRHLPNGWSFGLPNAVYRTPQGRAFDVEGIPPDIAVPVFSDDDVTAGRDAAMAAAMKLLRN